MAKVVLEVLGISKSFGDIQANRNISIKLYEGEIISILGENGAGKSTLMNILYGLYQPDEGRILLDGKEFRASSPREAITKGLGMVHQHFMLVETLSVTQNIILGKEPLGRFGINYRKSREEVVNLSERYHLEIDPDDLIANLSVGLQQRVEILKALYRKARILILDEPTSVLTPQEIENFFFVVKNLRKQGVSVIIITHKLEEIRAISERVYILRKGRITGEFATQNVSTADLARHMVGRDISDTIFDAFFYAPLAYGPTPQMDCAILNSASANNRFREFFLSVSVHAGDSNNLTGANIERQPINSGYPAVVRYFQIINPKTNFI